ncbi:MAG: hypothetical protein CL608_23755 [Anaerolineaceae bacterium]|nr:hypothetical protein [Anaerolineaceae bacterium]
MKRIFLFFIVMGFVSIHFPKVPSSLWWQQAHPQTHKPIEAAKESISRSRPLPPQQQRCAVQEQAILASVVRIVFHGQFQQGQHTDFRGSFGHATVVNGRYLITHNHFSIDLTALSASNPQGVTGFSLYNAAGQRILHNAPVGTFQASAHNAETLILDFGENYFNDLEIMSAPFKSVEALTLTVGSEVGQIDWDGQQAYVVWTTVTEIVQDHATPHLVLDNYVMPGASGGGIFWNGYHIANSWADVTIKNARTGEFLGSFSLAALNDQINHGP